MKRAKRDTESRNRSAAYWRELRRSNPPKARILWYGANKAAKRLVEQMYGLPPKT